MLVVALVTNEGVRKHTGGTTCVDIDILTTLKLFGGWKLERTGKRAEERENRRNIMNGIFLTVDIDGAGQSSLRQWWNCSCP